MRGLIGLEGTDEMVILRWRSEREAGMKINEIVLCYCIALLGSILYVVSGFV